MKVLTYQNKRLTALDFIKNELKLKRPDLLFIPLSI
jgi:hypothetical protein